jgi:hypothetical protein
MYLGTSLKVLQYTVSNGIESKSNTVQNDEIIRGIVVLYTPSFPCTVACTRSIPQPTCDVIIGYSNQCTGTDTVLLHVEVDSTGGLAREKPRRCTRDENDAGCTKLNAPSSQ